ncbi:hypothetical protein [Vibrio parahaemolyticus]|nr:hypothetical protein [Vibrio parahaemolyticus]
MYLYQRSTDDFVNAFVGDARTGKVLDATFPLGLVNSSELKKHHLS